MFRAHLQEVNDVNCTCMQPLVFSFSAGGRLVHLLSNRTDHDQQHCYHHVPTVNQRPLLQLIGS